MNILRGRTCRRQGLQSGPTSQALNVAVAVGGCGWEAARRGGGPGSVS